MTETARIVSRGRIALYGASGVAALALAASVFLLTRAGSSVGSAVFASLPASVILGFVSLAARYPCAAIPLWRSSVTRIVVTHALSAAAAGGLWILVWQAWRPVVARMLDSAIPADDTLLFGLAMLLYLMAVAMHYLTLEVEAAREAEQTALRYKVLAREAELKAFKAQLDPHFLFNSLNAVASLCGSRPQDAREMSQRLADFFRQTLRLGSEESITLAEEVDLVSRYLSIEQIRFGDRLSVDLTVDDQAVATTIPPLILQPIVENAVRHGIASMVEGGVIRLTANAEDGIVRIVVENPADPDRADGGGEGIGLANVRGRLETFFGGRSAMRASEARGEYRVEIEVPR